MTIDQHDRAFPAWPTWPSGEQSYFPGLPAIAYAAIQLRVPMSGAPWLDAMIREARRMDAAEKAMQGFIARAAKDVGIELPGWQKAIGWLSVSVADALLAELGKERKE